MPFQLIHGDITTQQVDAIVNAANSSLLGGGGVDGAIHRAAGPDLLKECRTLGGCSTGEAKITKGYNLPASYVIHTVGPIWRGGLQGEEILLRSCYRNSLKLAKETGCLSVAFPLISAGVYGYPIEEARQIATEEIRQFLQTDGEVDTPDGEQEEMSVSLVLFDPSSVWKSDPELRRYIEAREQRRYAVYHNAPYENASYKDIPYGDASSGGASFESTIEDLADAALMPQAMPMQAPMPSMPEPSKSAAPKRSRTNLRSKMSKSLSDLESTVESKVESALGSLSEFLKKQDKGFVDQLLQMIDEKDMTDPECYKRANISRKTFSKIRNGEMKPGKEMVLAFCVALKLTIPEAEMLLKKAGYALTESSLTDLIVMYFLSKRIYDIDKINLELYNYDQKLLGSSH